MDDPKMKELLKQYEDDIDGMTILGVPLSGMTREELMCCIALCGDRIGLIRKEHSFTTNVLKTTGENWMRKRYGAW